MIFTSFWGDMVPLSPAMLCLVRGNIQWRPSSKESHKIATFRDIILVWRPCETHPYFGGFESYQILDTVSRVVL